MKSYRPLSIYVTDTVAGTVVVGRKALIQNFRPYIVSKPNKYKQIPLILMFAHGPVRSVTMVPLEVNCVAEVN